MTDGGSGEQGTELERWVQGQAGEGLKHQAKKSEIYSVGNREPWRN